MQDQDSPPSVVVGIDGSRPALDAALWAVVYAIDPGKADEADSQGAAP